MTKWLQSHWIKLKLGNPIDISLKIQWPKMKLTNWYVNKIVKDLVILYIQVNSNCWKLITQTFFSKTKYLSKYRYSGKHDILRWNCLSLTIAISLNNHYHTTIIKFLFSNNKWSLKLWDFTSERYIKM